VEGKLGLQPGELGERAYSVWKDGPWGLTEDFRGLRSRYRTAILSNKRS
jgi:hypothetical protein